MTAPIVWITGASDGIGAALAASIPWPGARVIGISRRPPPVGEHLPADLADPASWAEVARSFATELEDFAGERAVLVQAAGTLDPIGYAGEVDSVAYTTNVVLNSATPQVLGHAFLAAARHSPTARQLVILTSGAATTAYAGWSSYGAAKAAADQWVRTVGAEQAARGGALVLAVAPGTVDTGMQARIRATPDVDFPQKPKFAGLHERGELAAPDEVARRIWGLLDAGLETGSVVDLRTVGVH